MTSLTHPTGASPSRPPEQVEPGPPSIGFVIHRQRPLGWAIPRIANVNYHILALALSGRAAYECGDERFDATRGTMLFFPRGAPHAARSDPRAPWSFYSVGFRLDTTDQAELDSFSDLPSHLMVANVTQIAEYFRQLHRLWNAREPGYTMACRGLILLLMQQYVVAAQRSRRRIPNAARIQSVITRMHQSVGVVLSVSELAAMARLSESRFRTLFHAMTGCSVTRYQNRLRISAAQDLLASGHYGVTAVSRELGFRDVYYFSRLFKRMTGVCPSQWPNR